MCSHQRGYSSQRDWKRSVHVQNKEVFTIEGCISSKNPSVGPESVQNQEVFTIQGCSLTEVLLYIFAKKQRNKSDATVVEKPMRRITYTQIKNSTDISDSISHEGSTLELFPDELLLELFSFIKPSDLYHGFVNLNQRLKIQLFIYEKEINIYIRPAR